MKHIVLFVLAIFYQPLYSQTMTLEIDRSTYRTFEKIEISFEADFIPDSILAPYFDSLVIYSGPIKSSQTSYVNGTRTQKSSYKYVLMANREGHHRCKSPVFYLDGTLYSINEFSIIVNGPAMSSEELKEAKVKSFAEMKFKPAGSQRWVMSGKTAYMEYFNGSDWVFMRSLSKKEIRKLQKIK